MRRFGEPPEIIEDSFEKVVMYGQSLHTFDPLWRGKWGEIYKRQEKIKIKDDEILLFTEDKDREKPVMLKVPTMEEGMTILVAAIQGGGKSGVVKAWLDQFILKNCKILYIEPKGYDSVTMGKPQDDPAAFPILEKFGMKPKGYKIQEVIPEFVAEDEPHARKWKLDVGDFWHLPKTTQISTWCNFLDIKEMSGAGRMLQDVLMMGTKEKGPKNIEQMMHFTDVQIRKDTERRKMIKMTGVSSKALLYRLEQKVRTMQLGKGRPFDFVKSMVENDVTILRTPFDSENLVSMNVYISVAINRILADRTRYVKTNGRIGFQSQPIVIVVEEADFLIGTHIKNIASHVLYNIPARRRHEGISLILITQNSDLIQDKFVRASKYIATTQVTHESQKKILRMRSVPEFLIQNKLARLEVKSGDFPVNEWLFLDPNEPGEAKTGFPIYPRTKLLKPGEGLKDIYG